MKLINFKKSVLSFLKINLLIILFILFYILFLIWFGIIVSYNSDKIAFISVIITIPVFGFSCLIAYKQCDENKDIKKILFKQTELLESIKHQIEEDFKLKEKDSFKFYKNLKYKKNL